jgi:hypothetical protein
MKKIMIIIGFILGFGLAGAGGFWGGITYQTNKDAQAQANFFNTRGGSTLAGQPVQIRGNGNFPDSGMLQGGMGLEGGSGTSGQVKSLEGDVLLLSTAQDVTTVKITAGTIIQAMKLIDISELEPGTRVTVMGERDNDGNIQAAQIMIVTTTAPADAGMEP